jgi:hypothetical protein
MAHISAPVEAVSALIVGKFVELTVATRGPVRYDNFAERVACARLPQCHKRYRLRTV